MKYKFTICEKNMLGDMHTPVCLYLKLRDIYPESVLLESSDYHANQNSLSYIAVSPLASVGVNNVELTTVFPDGNKKVKEIEDCMDISNGITDFIGQFDINGENKDICGLFGYTAFDAVRYFENIPIKEYHHRENDAPDMLYVLYRYILVFNHFSNRLKIVELVPDGEESKIMDIETIIKDRNYASYNFKTDGKCTSSISDEEYKEMVRKGIRHCLRGDVFQVVLSRRFEQRFKGDDFKVYRALRSINPSPYLFYFDFGGFRIFGSSPETHCKIVDGMASIDPIAGTAFRTGDVNTDKARTEALLADPKENSEHVMLVDLARNDLSRNTHNVKVDFYKEVQYYSHVIHLVSRVSGEVSEGCSTIKTFIDTFPAGTLSGAPKVRAMQLISEIEKHSRGAYGGCIGFIGLNGNLNQAITIRTFVSRENTLYFQAGAGIVAKSNDERELQEVNSKLGALFKAVREAENLIN